jgi:hypothetical protein
VGEVGAERRVRASRTTLIRVTSLRDLSHCVGEVYLFARHPKTSQTVMPVMVAPVAHHQYDHRRPTTDN